MYRILLAIDTEVDRSISQAQAIIDFAASPDSIAVTIAHGFEFKARTTNWLLSSPSTE